MSSSSGEDDTDEYQADDADDTVADDATDEDVREPRGSRKIGAPASKSRSSNANFKSTHNDPEFRLIAAHLHGDTKYNSLTGYPQILRILAVHRPEGMIPLRCPPKGVKMRVEKEEEEEVDEKGQAQFEVERIIGRRKMKIEENVDR
jgi:hypothetical protein